jgi:hypothetical protein
VSDLHILHNWPKLTETKVLDRKNFHVKNRMVPGLDGLLPKTTFETVID